MLEVKNLYREYKPKKGTPVVALNDVSLKFPDKGLIFILGKSGSGKSTLLNVMGGLDKLDGGDIIIKGKSSKDFKQKDFDSYRNTYLGFIFQEYNILDEFNVGQNIALAIELQGRKATSAEINNILKEVDLEGYGQRKTNELSGGQKQRVAIARALVKNPEIIFGDEPTGALDSKTGIQVFDTLKKLAENKLVIVVSHDREFAEMYGDRVIELADGKVISDISKVKVQGEKKNSGISVIDNKVLRIEKDYELTDADMAIVKEYLNRSKCEKLISFDENLNAGIKHVARIDDFGNREAFKMTSDDDIVNKNDEYRIIKSKLSLRHCLRIGASSLKSKPFRLVITILLSVVAFAMFGLADTLASYDGVTAAYNTMLESNTEYVGIKKNISYRYDEDSDPYFQNDFMSEKDFLKLNIKYDEKLTPVYNLSNSTYESSAYVSGFGSYSSEPYYPTTVGGAVVLSNSQISNLGFSFVAGSYPENLGEIAITKVLYESFKKYGYDSIKPQDVSYDTIIGKEIIICSEPLKVTGIIDTGFDRTPYPAIDKNSDNYFGSYINAERFNNDYIYSYSSLIYTKEDTAEALRKIAASNLLYYIYVENYYGGIGNLSKASSSSDIVGNKNPAKNELVVSYDVFYNSLYSSLYDFPIDYTYNGYNYTYMRDLLYAATSKEDFKAIVTEFKTQLFENLYPATIQLRVKDEYVIMNESYNVVGIDFSDTASSYEINSSDYDTLFEGVEEPFYSFALGSVSDLGKGNMEKILEETYNKDAENNKVVYRANNGIMPMYMSFNSTITEMASIFLYIGIGFAVFAGLMLFNFISISISYKKREIGILRAVGARSKDVFGIFMSESAIIALIAYAFALISTFVISYFINKAMIEDYNILLTLLNPGLRQVVIVLAVSLGVAFVSTLLPVYKIAMKRPIDAIRDR